MLIHSCSAGIPGSVELNGQSSRGSMKFVGSTTGKRELYDLSKDPNETKNIAALNQELTDELQASLSAVVTTAPKARSNSHEMDRKSLDRLKSLGYVQ